MIIRKKKAIIEIYVYVTAWNRLHVYENINFTTKARGLSYFVFSSFNLTLVFRSR